MNYRSRYYLTIKELRDLQKYNKIKSIFHRSLKSERDPVDEIAAVYFIMPTKDNISPLGKVK
jgi:hypothetical protein